MPAGIVAKQNIENYIDLNGQFCKQMKTSYNPTVLTSTARA